MSVRGFEHAGMSVADLDAMSSWYQEALGLVLEVSSEVPKFGARSVILRGTSNNYRIELIQIPGSQPNPNGAPLPSDSLKFHGYGHIALRVDDLDSTFQALLDAGAGSVIPPRGSPAMNERRYRVGSAGVQVEVPQEQIPPVRHAYVTDPEGNQIELMDYPDAPS